MAHTLLRSLNLESLPAILIDLLGFPPRDGQIRAMDNLAID